MILNLDHSDSIKIGTEGLQMGIDLNDPAKLFYILSQGFYQNPMRAIVQEITSNIYDSTVASGKDILDYPGYIILTEKTIEFKDFGEGISEERMEKIMSKFFATTKARNTELLGTFGLGFKSIFSYAPQFTVISVHEGVERIWLFSKDAVQIDIVKLKEEPVDKENQTSFIVSINNDANKWYQTVIETVPYFKGIIFDCQVDTTRTYPNWNKAQQFNETELIEGENFYYRDKTYNGFHICLDQVIYKLNTSDLGISLGLFPFALKFSVADGIVPLPNRESILLSENVKTLIKEKLKACLEELHKYYEQKELNLVDYFSNQHYLELTIKDINVSLNWNEIEKLCSKLGVKSFIRFNPVFSDISNLSNKQEFFKSCLKRFGEVKSNGIHKYSYDYINLQLSNYILIEQDLTNSLKRYLRDQYRNYELVKKRRLKFWGRDGYYLSLGLESVPREKWVTIVRAFIKEQEQWIKKCSTINQEEYKDWLKDNKLERQGKRKLDNDEIKFKSVQPKVRGYGYKLVPLIYKENEFTKGDIYVTFDELNTDTKNFTQINRVNCIIIDDKNLEKLKQVSYIGVFSFEEFKQSRYFKSLVYQKWLYNNKSTTYERLRSAVLDHNGIMLKHCKFVNDIHVNRSLPTFLDQYELDSRYLPMKHYLERVGEKALKLSPENINRYDWHQVGKMIFIKDLKIKRLEKQLEFLKIKH